MAYSKCPSCNNSYFELKENSPTDSQFKLQFVQCSSCGAVVGAMDYWNLGTVSKDIEKKVNKIDSDISSIKSQINTVNYNIGLINQSLSQLYALIKSKQ
jgi:transcription initiation factor IIE alpha subunit